MSTKRILIATIVPFWELKTGAQQRIYSILKALISDGHQVRVFFPAAADAEAVNRAVAIGVDVQFVRPDQRPPSTERSFFKTLAWHFRGTLHAVQRQISRTQSKRLRDAKDSHDAKVANGSHDADNGRNRPTTDSRQRPFDDADRQRPAQRPTQRLEDFNWAWASAFFNDGVASFSPDAIICEYVTMAYLVQGLPRSIRRQTHCLIDTHDLLSYRQSQFASRRQNHWIDISPDQESAALNVFDTIIAIEAEEAQQMRAMAPQRNVILVGHNVTIADRSDDPADCSTDRTAPKQSLTVGYLGSNNASNIDAVQSFLRTVAEPLCGQSEISFLIAGSVCDAISSSAIGPNVRVLGPVDQVGDFYRLVDAVVNPVEYGTGLKIKSIEAIAFEKPLLSTPYGWSGNPLAGVTVVPRLIDMVEVLKGWGENRTVFEQTRHEAKSSSATFNDTYQPLLDLLRELPL